MSEPSFHFKVVTPEEVPFEGLVVSVVAPGTLGYLGVLVNHAPLVTTLAKGNLTFRDGQGKTQSFKIDGGYLEVLNNHVLVLTDGIKGS